MLGVACVEPAPAGVDLLSAVVLAQQQSRKVGSPPLAVRAIAARRACGHPSSATRGPELATLPCAGAVYCLVWHVWSQRRRGWFLSSCCSSTAAVAQGRLLTLVSAIERVCCPCTSMAWRAGRWFESRSPQRKKQRGGKEKKRVPALARTKKRREKAKRLKGWGVWQRGSHT